ncbi:type I-E CRISPR-associated protein Cas5/CasD [Bifidobacterium aerophilum]|uniref:Type I-E CRISPR-associated protein Cas5/CasD n=1 Tax=Bifidobacterium aerophilum TaxID=1798155 RepID=A0A6N9Z6L8_9BIFI|nr:type I-E CRISPR-associated protein Cas5/CasD [Bifidobacterium aerophilum]NEG89753.1 type I-E CRISPR-associated protein Cas5/CasD [Bifidobacterium aerophilum]
MPVLLMRLAAPMQSWGASSRFTRRETEMMPTKSGVIGMLAAALGIGRDEPLTRFAGLRFGVRVDQPGTVMSDFHTAEDLKNERPGSSKKEMLPLSVRYYLQDAVFLVGVESRDGNELERYRRALASPYYPIFLGRRSCPPDGPIQTWMSDETLENALRNAPWRADGWYQRKVLRGAATFPERCFARIVVEPGTMKPDANDEDRGDFIDTIADEPVSFDPRERRWRTRGIMQLADDAKPTPTVEVMKGVGHSVTTDGGDAIFDAVRNAMQDSEDPRDLHGSKEETR